MRWNLDMWDSPKTLFVTNSAVSKDKDRQSFKLRPGMDKKIVIYVQQTSNKELAIERYVLSLHREDILIPLQPIIHLIMINMCWIMSFLHLSVPFGPWEHVGCFFSTVTDVVLNWSQPCLNAQLCFSVYICFLRLCTRRWVCGYAVLQSICVVPVWFCCSDEHVCVSGVSVCSWAQGRM